MKKLLSGKAPSKADRILKSSSKAVCGIQEREVTVLAKNVSATKSLLESGGFFIVGVSEPIGKMRKIWFSRVGGF